MIKFQHIIFVCTFAYSSALDLELAQEGPCLNLTALPLDPSMFKNYSVKWYTPLISKYELYRIVESITHKNAEEISDQELKSLCPTSVSGVSGPEGVGAGGAFVELSIESDPEDPNVMLVKVIGHIDWESKLYITKTEKDYFVGVSCWRTGQRSWSANTNLKNFSAEQKAEIYRHVKSLGFKDTKYYYEYDYEDCDKTVTTAYCLKECLKNK